jgi:nitroreductase
MSKFVLYLKKVSRPWKYLFLTAHGFSYDFVRVAKFGGWSLNNEDREIRNYKVVKIYHRLEKSLSFRERNSNSGWSSVRELLKVLQVAKKDGNLGFQDRVGANVAKIFVSKAVEQIGALTGSELMGIDELQADLSIGGGVISVDADEFSSGSLDNPERFFLSRHSLRDFSDKKISKDLIERAIKLAQKTPSVCSRQAWHVYLIDRREVIDTALSFQNGNRGFGHEVPALLVVTADLKAFDVGAERYQPWIDGGMFAMSLVWALHALGVGSCCLNWSKDAADDRSFRKSFPIAGKHSIITFIAVGHPKPEVKICASVRRPVSEIFSTLESS